MARTAIQEARTALGLSWRYIEAFEAEAAALYAQAMSVDEVRHFAAKPVKLDEPNISLPATGQRHDKANSIVKLFVSSSPIVASSAGTRWAAYNALSEWADHFSPVREAHNPAEANATRALARGVRQHRRQGPPRRSPANAQ
jgi:hypothetical protein